MRNSEADIAINTLNKLARKELDIEGDVIRNDYRNLKEAPSIRFHAYTTARDEIRRALAAAANESDAENPFLPQRDELVTQDMHTCDLCGRRWKLYAASSHLTIWTELPERVVWLLRHKTWKTMHNQKR